MNRNPECTFIMKDSYFDEDEYILVTGNKREMERIIREVAYGEQITKDGTYVRHFNYNSSLRAVLAGEMDFLIHKANPYLNHSTYKKEHEKLVSELKKVPNTCRIIWKLLTGISRGKQYNHEEDFKALEALPYLELKDHYDREMEEQKLYK